MTGIQAANPSLPRSTSAARLLCRAALNALPAAALCLGLGVVGTPVRAAELPAFEISARDGRLFPERLEVPPRVKLKLTLRNEGRVPVEIENLELRLEKVLAPNSAAVVIIQPLKSGSSFTIVDEFNPDAGKMQLIVR